MRLIGISYHINFKVAFPRLDLNALANVSQTLLLRGPLLQIEKIACPIRNKMLTYTIKDNFLLILLD